MAPICITFLHLKSTWIAVSNLLYFHNVMHFEVNKISFWTWFYQSQINWMDLNFKLLLLDNIASESSIHNLAFFSEKKTSHLNQEWNTHRSTTVLNKDVRTTAGEFFFTGWSVNMDYRQFCPEVGLRLKCSFSLHKMLADGLELGRLLVICFNQLFGLSFWRHPLDPMVSNLCNAKSVPNEETNSSTSWMVWGWRKL